MQDFDKPKEECGIFGIYSQPGAGAAGVHPATAVYTALYALQHRGQDSCGISVGDRGIITTYKDVGLVSEVFDAETVARMSGEMAIGHVMYSAAGKPTRENAQPLSIMHFKGNMALAYNGGLVNAAELRYEFEQGGAIFQTTGDAEVIAYLLVRERLKATSIQEALKNAMKYMQGAVSLVVMSPRKLLAARGPHGFRPLAIGRLGDVYVFASESCAFEGIGAEFVRDVLPGEIVTIENGALSSDFCEVKAEKSLCVFEYVYTARPDSVIDGVSVETSRQDMGRVLARTYPVDADIVIDVPNSGLSAALGYSMESGMPYARGLVINRYIGRTFIQPTQRQRENSVALKLSALSAVVSGKRVVMVDDSIVRGTTTAKTVKKLKNAGAVEVHLRVAAPPYMYSCYFGTDISAKDKLIANEYSPDEVARILGADSFRYLPVEALDGIAQGICKACFTGKYPLEIPGHNINTHERRL